MYLLYGKKGSGSAAIEAALELVAAPYRLVEAASWEPNDAFAGLLKVNPLGQIPTLVLSDGSVLSESAAILIHLGGAHPESVRGLVFIAANCYAAISIIDYPERWCADADSDNAVKERIRAGTRERLHRHWEIFADLFPARPWLSGAEPGALDVHAAVVSKWSGARKHLEQRRPDFFALLQRIESHPKLSVVFNKHWPAS